MEKKKYPVIAMIGSSKFKAEYEYCAKELTLQGALVIPLIFYKSDTESFEKALENMDLLKAICNQKVEMADMVFVVNPCNYIGPRTQTTIEYAKSLNKPIRYMSEEFPFTGTDTCDEQQNTVRSWDERKDKILTLLDEAVTARKMKVLDGDDDSFIIKNTGNGPDFLISISEA